MDYLKQAGIDGKVRKAVRRWCKRHGLDYGETSLKIARALKPKPFFMADKINAYLKRPARLTKGGLFSRDSPNFAFNFSQETEGKTVPFMPWIALKNRQDYPEFYKPVLLRAGCDPGDLSSYVIGALTELTIKGKNISAIWVTDSGKTLGGVDAFAYLPNL